MPVFPGRRLFGSVLRVDHGRWEQTVADLRHLALTAAHPRSRERFLALHEIAQGSCATAVAERTGRLALLSNFGPAVLANFGPPPASQPRVAPIGSGDLAWTGEPKWICSNSFVGSMSLASARSRGWLRSLVCI